MALERRGDVRNVALIAHVDHGKSTLVDSLQWQTEALLEGCRPEQLAERFDPSREKQIGVVPKLISLTYGSARINIVDLPGHANFGTEVERNLRLVDGFLLIVDACEGPLPQNRYVLRRALEAALTPVVVLNKIDLPTADPERVLLEVRDLFLDLDASEDQRRFAVVYVNAIRGLCRSYPHAEERPLTLLLDALLERVPPPSYDPEATFRMQVTQVGYDDFLGRLAVGRVEAGSVRPGSDVTHVQADGEHRTLTLTGLFGWRGTDRVEISHAGPGDIVALPGIDRVRLGDTLADPAEPKPLPALPPEQPTLAIEVGVNDSPTAGREGSYATAEQLRERFWRELLTNPAVRIEDTSSPGRFRIRGRSELQLVILLEILRREGYEFVAGRPHVLAKDVDGLRHEPFENLVVDFPEVFDSIVRQKIEARGGRLTRMVNHGRGRVRMEYRLPSAGLVGFRTEYLADTRRTGILNHSFDGYAPGEGRIPRRTTGVLVATRAGRASADAIEHLQSRGTMFVAPTDTVYRGMIVGENSGPNDVDVDVTKQSRREAPSSGESRRTVRLVPPRSMSLEQALEFLLDEELVEITPNSLRLRKRDLDRRGGLG
jgi:GTP-binding protein